MRSDMKIGLICVFAIVLGVVIYFVAQGNAHPQKAQAAPGAPAAGSASNAIATPPAPAATPGALPASGTTVGQTLASANGGGSMGGGFIAAPGSTTTGPSTAPAAGMTGAGTGTLSTPGMGGTTPGLVGGQPTTGPASSGNSSLVPPSFTPYTPSRGSSGTGTTGSGSGTGATLEIGGSGMTGGSSSGGGFGSGGLGTGGMGTGSSLPGLGTGGGMATTHKIEKGDMLGTISKKYGVTVKAIEEANKGIDSTRLKVGSTINIPAASATVASTKPATTKPAKVAGTKPAKAAGASGTAVASGGAKAGASYVVKKGDTLSTIARAAYGVKGSWKKIADANKTAVPDPNNVAIGTEITIPQ